MDRTTRNYLRGWCGVRLVEKGKVDGILGRPELRYLIAEVGGEIRPGSLSLQVPPEQGGFFATDDGNSSIVGDVYHPGGKVDYRRGRIEIWSEHDPDLWLAAIEAWFHSVRDCHPSMWEA